MSRNNMNRSAGSRLLIFFVLLSTLNVGAIVLCLVLTNRIAASYESSVQSSDRWSREAGNMGELIKLAQLTIAPPNDVFESMSPDMEQERSIPTRLAFDSRLGECVRGLQEAVENQRSPLFLNLERVSELMELMSKQSTSVFRHFKRGDLAAAGNSMAAADRTFAMATALLLESQDQLRAMAQRDREEHMGTITAIGRQQKVLVALTGFLILCSTIYARRLSRRVVGIGIVEKNLVDLRASEVRFAQAARATRDVIWEWDLANERVWYSEQAGELFGSPMPANGWLSFEEATRFTHPDDFASLKASLTEMVGGSSVRWEFPYRVLRPDGTIRSVVNRVYAVRDGTGHAVAMYGAISDITEREHALRALRESEERFRLSARATSDVLWDWNLGTNEIWVNDLFLERYPVEASSNVAKMPDVSALRHPDDKVRVQAGLQRFLSSDDDTWADDYRILRRDGTWADVRNRAFKTKVLDGTAMRLVGALTDVSDQTAALRSARETAERFRLTAMATNDALWDWNLVTDLCTLSDSFYREYGISESEYPGNTVPVSVWTDRIHPDDAPRLHSELHQLFEGDGVSWVGEYRFQRADGTYAEIYDRGYVVRDEEGRPQRMVGAMANVTHRKRIERELQQSNQELLQLSRRHRLILDATADAIIGISMDRRVVFANRASAALLGFPVTEMAGRTVDALLGMDPFAEPASERGPAMLQGTFSRKDGTMFCGEYQLSQIIDENGEVAGFVLTFRDVTERQLVQKMKNEFVSIVSHELRTPLTSIRGALGLLEGGLLGTVTDRGQRMLSIAVSNTDRLVRLINDILDIERMESGNVTLTTSRCDAAELIEQAVDIMRTMAEKGGIELEVEKHSAMIWADPDRILQTLTNLLGNAIKFSPPDTRIVVSLEETKSRNVVFHVRDEGRGIPPEKLELVFERFLQVDASDSREKGGSGLGLAICRSIVKQHGGDIWVTSAPGKGSTFSFSIPAVLSSAPDGRVEATGAAGAGHSGSPRRVLICDDDPSIREVLQAILEGNSFEVLAVASGVDVLERVESFHPHAIVLDVLMPYMDGWDTMAALRANPATSEIPIVFATVLEARQSQKGQDAPEAWIQKPLDEASFIDALQGILGMEERRPRVVLIEDDLDLAKVIIASFQDHEIEMFHAEDGEKAIELFETTVPDLVILDVVLPELDGYAIVERLRERKEFRRVPVVVYSVDELSAFNRERLALGPTEFLTKSRITPAEFERRVIGMLSRITDQKARHVA